MGFHRKSLKVLFWPLINNNGLFLLLHFAMQLHVPQFSLAALPTRIAKNETDRLSLLEFKSHINDPLGFLSSWNNSIHLCQWPGISCGRRHQRVTGLDLESKKLSGPLSPHVGNLSFLRELYLDNNSFSQEIPSELGHLTRLEVLVLNNNSFSGEIPGNLSFCSKLVFLNVAWNSLVGELPDELGGLSKVQWFFFHVNNLTGTIPPSFGNLTSLQRFSATQNNIGGGIPDASGQWKSLTHISLAANRFSGEVPSSFFNLSSMIFLDLAYNQLQGTLPQDIGITLPNLQNLGLSSNQFTGSIPFTICNATNLVYFSTNHNKHTGSVPTLENLHTLFFFSLSTNHLGSGAITDLSFLSSLVNNTGLEFLALNDNNFGGIFPQFIGNFSMLTTLLLDGNKISGSIPNGISNLINLERLEAWENRLSGEIPPSIGDLSQLVILRLSANNFSGVIPSSLGNLVNLTSLHLAKNNLQGSIPTSLGLCQNLLELELAQNNLNGTIPPEVFGLSSLSIVLDLSRNSLRGSIPREVGNLRNLGYLDVSENMLYGKIPDSLGSCTTLETLRMEHNSLEGPLPSTLSSLQGLRVLDLSRNNLSGQIPKFLEKFSLQYLNLSYNNFEGQVPTEGSFKNASAVSVIGNNKLCSDIPELNLPLCNFHKSHKGRLTLKLKIVISVICGLLLLTFLLSGLYLCCLPRRKSEPQAKCSENSLWKVSYQTLLKATAGFSSDNLIGEGSFGSVYRGIIDESGTIVAIKVLNLLRHGASKSFMAECEALRNIRHRNLVKIVTACSGTDFRGNEFKALIYEFMVKGSLEKWLHPAAKTDEGNEAPTSLNLLERLNIAIDVACALDYLHNDCQPAIVHCDLKPSNILLDDEMTGHVGDFGLARVLPEAMSNLSNNQISSIGVKGTVGYAAPEYGLGSQVSKEGDVYSYGVLLLEMFTGKRPTNEMFKDSFNIHQYVKAALPHQVIDIVDPALHPSIEEDRTTQITSQNRSSKSIYTVSECLTSIFSIGVACSQDLSSERMRISTALAELQSIKNKLARNGWISAV